MDLTRDLPLLIVLGMCFVAAIVLAGAEVSLIRIPRVRAETMAEGGSTRGRRLLRLLDELPQVLNSILLTVLLVQIGAATVTGLLAERWFGNIGVTVASIVLTFVLFVYTEAIPKTFAYRHPERVAGAVAYPVSWLTAVLRPIVSALVWFADLHVPGRGIETAPTVTERELLRLAEAAADEGQIDPGDLLLIERAFRLGDRTVAEVMVPRVDVVFVDVSATVASALEVALAAGHRRLVVCDGDLDHLTGLVLLRDLAAVAERERDRGVIDLVVKPAVVTEFAKVIVVLRDMEREATHMVVVVDEHGGTAGIVTAEDIAEELLGAVAEGDADSTGEVQQVGPGRWIVDASVLVDDLGEQLETTLPEGDWTTAAGMVMGLSGSVPRVGVEVDAAGYRFRVAAVRRRRIRVLDVTADDASEEHRAAD